MTRQVADHLLKGNVNLGGELVPVTVLFSDIRSFTSISETMPPRALLDFLNEYFSGMVESVMMHDGVVDKFIGDAIMAVFGAPVPRPGRRAQRRQGRARDARRASLKMNEGFRARGLPELRTGIGLHTGEVVAGNMGHAKRMEYTVIGDAVNLASRLEGHDQGARAPTCSSPKTSTRRFATTWTPSLSARSTSRDASRR